MKVLPPASQPWDDVFVRRHTPAPTTAAKGYRKYRPCLRWEFGFSCAFCLVHEVDLGLAVGESLMETEHFVPVSVDPTLENSYPNCFYCCHFCNHHRRRMPIVDRFSGRLLNPCADVWQKYFVLEDNELRPLNEHPDAVYTRDAYDLNEPRKVKMRKLRKETVEECLETYREAGPLSKELVRQATEAGSEREDLSLNVARIDKARELWKESKKAWLQLERYAAIPWDAPLWSGEMGTGQHDKACRCPGRPSLPGVLDRQSIDLGPSPF